MYGLLAVPLLKGHPGNSLLCPGASDACKLTTDGAKIELGSFSVRSLKNLLKVSTRNHADIKPDAGSTKAMHALGEVSEELPSTVRMPCPALRLSTPTQSKTASHWPTGAVPRPPVTNDNLQWKNFKMFQHFPFLCI